MRSCEMEGFDRLEKEFDRFLDSVPELRSRGVLAGYSGGMDSGVLLALLASRGIRPLRAVHVVHNLRPEAELQRELELVKKFCATLSVPLTVARIRPGMIEAHARKKSISIEAAAREYRYSAFRSVSRRFSLGCLCVAHNLDDSLETMLARVMGSSSLDGLGGIAPKRRLSHGLLLTRPLAGISRAQIDAWAKSRMIPVSEDSTNTSVQYQRNRLRHLILPLLDREFPGWRTGLEGTMARLSADRTLVRDLLRRATESCHFDKATTSFQIDAGVFDSWERALKTRILMYCLGFLRRKKAGRRDMRDSGCRISHAAVMEAVLSLEKGAKRLRLLDFMLERHAGFLRILPGLDFPMDHGYFLQIPGPGIHVAGPLRITIEHCVGKAATPGAEKCFHAAGGGFLNGNSFSFPLVIRSRKPGDSMRIDGVERRIDDVMKAARLPCSLRARLPVIEDRQGIVALLGRALVGYGVDYDRFRESGLDQGFPEASGSGAGRAQFRIAGAAGSGGFHIWIEGA